MVGSIKKSARARRLTACQAGLLLVLLVLGSSPAPAIETVRLQLKWTHSFQFAGYYAAQSLGYYRDAGLEVSLIEGEPGLDVVETVVDGEADFGVGTSGLLLERSRGQPVVVLATIFQHSPLILIARTDHPLQSIHDLSGKSVMIEPHSEELIAYFRREGLQQAQLEWVEHSFTEQALIDGTIDAMSAYASHEPYFLDQAGLAYQLYSPRSAGIDFYGDSLFTSSRMLGEHAERVRAFVNASLRGWEYALEHPEDTITLIRDHYGTDLDPKFLRFQAEQMTKLIRPDLVEIGYMYPGRWRHIADVYADLGMMERDFALNGFLYSARTERDLTWLHRLLFGVVALAAVLFGLNVSFARVNRRYRASLEATRQAETARAESESILRTLMQTASAGICMLDGRRLVFVNDAMTRLTGYRREELLGMRELEMVDPEYRELVGRRAESRQRGGSEPKQYEIKLRTKHGAPRWIALTAELTTYQGRDVSIATLSDITERRLAEKALRQSEQQYRLITENMQDVIWVMDAENGNLLFVSPSVEQLRGYDRESYAATSFEQWFTPESRARLQVVHSQRLKAFLSGEASPDTTYRDEVEHTRRDGSTVWCEVVARFRRNPRTRRAELYGVTRDIAKRKAMEEELRRANAELTTLASTDVLTGLPNRRLFYEIAERALSSARRNRGLAAVMSLDLDKFKPINDSYGHEVGDRVLIETSRRLTLALRQSDTGARFGGDEFLILLPQISRDEDVMLVAEKIRALFEAKFVIEDFEMSISVSIGASIYPRHGDDIDALIKASDQALYVTKERGGGGLTVFGI